MLVNPQRNYAQFLLRALLPMVIHVGDRARRRLFGRLRVPPPQHAAWLACAGGNPIVALAGKLAPLFCIFVVIMLAVPLVLEGVLEIPFRGDVPLIVAAGSLLIIALPRARRAAAAPGARPRDGAWPHRASSSRPHSATPASAFPSSA